MNMVDAVALYYLQSNQNLGGSRSLELFCSVYRLLLGIALSAPVELFCSVYRLLLGIALSAHVELFCSVYRLLLEIALSAHVELFCSVYRLLLGIALSAHVESSPCARTCSFRSENNLKFQYCFLL